MAVWKDTDDCNHFRVQTARTTGMWRVPHHRGGTAAVPVANCVCVLQARRIGPGRDGLCSSGPSIDRECVDGLGILSARHLGEGVPQDLQDAGEDQLHHHELAAAQEEDQSRSRPAGLLAAPA
jgi:hypothetical protein